MDERPGATGARIDALDELRGLAIAAVVLSHVGLVFAEDSPVARALAAPALGVGVDLFFVISGFVVARSARRLAAGRDFWRGALAFWSRRVARIAIPGCAVVAAIGVSEAAGSALGATIGDLAAAAGFYANLHWAPCFEGRGECGAIAATSHFWSLALEMQFYAVAPFLALLSIRETRIFAGLVLIAGALASRPWGGSAWAFRADGLVIGVLIAREASSSTSWVHRAPPVSMGLAAYWLLVAAVLGRILANEGAGLGLAAIAMIFGAVVAGVLRDGATGGNATLLRLGRLSYSIYLVHLPVLAATRAALHDAVSAEMAMPAAIVAVGIAAIVLDRFVTTPAIGAGRKLSAWMSDLRKAEEATAPQ